MSIDLTKYCTYSWYAETNNGLQPVLAGLPAIPVNDFDSIEFADLFKSVFGQRYLCYPNKDPSLLWEWTEEATGLIQLNGGDITDRINNVGQLTGRALSTEAQETREIKAAPAGVLQSDSYTLGGEVLTRPRFPSFDEIRQYEELRPLISDLMRRFDGLFLPVVYGWDDQWPKLAT